MNTKLIFCICALISPFLLDMAGANIWHSYLSYYQAIAIELGDNKIFAANQNGIFSYNLADKSFVTKSRVEGLSDAGVSAICWSNAMGALLVGYSNGNLDLLWDNKTLNLPFIKDKATITNKSINNILCEGDFAWLCCGFGIVKVNVRKWEVAETWIIGPQATAVSVKGLAVDGRYFWAATGAGVFRAEKANPNLQDYQNWERQEQLPFPQARFNSITVFNGVVYTCDKDGRAYSFDGVSWQPAYPDITDIQKIKAYPSALVFVCNGSVIMTGANDLVEIKGYGSLLPATTKIGPSDALVGTSGELWIGDTTFGLFRRSVDQGFASIVPSCPANNNAQSLFSSSGKLYVATGREGSASATVAAEIHQFMDNKWISVNGYNENKLSGIYNVLKVVPSPSEPGHYWASTSGNGLLEFQGNKLIKQYNSSNSPLETHNGNCPTAGLAFDTDGYLWTTNPLATKQLHLVKPDGTWTSLGYPGIDNQFVSTGDLIITKANTKWLVVNKSQLFAINTHNTPDDAADDTYKKCPVQSRFSNSETTVIKGFSTINTIAEDHDGYLWVGTENGVVLYTNPQAIFGAENFYGSQPSVDLGDGIFHPVLENKTVTSIAIDGGNRKWFGTANSGVYLFSEDGSKLVAHFSTDNSPLFSDHINSIAINGQNGEVFFSTENGLVSWMGNATQGEGAFQNLYVWPNPVRETYQGEITIDGLEDKSTVKITDVTGNLVYGTVSIGGRATWNGKNRNGTRPNTGVYLIFCANSDGSQSRAIKLLFIH